MATEHERLFPFVYKAASALSKNLYRSGIDKEDIQQEGVAALLSIPKSRLRGGAEQLWEAFGPGIVSAMSAAGRAQRTASLEAIGEAINELEPVDLLEIKEVPMAPDEILEAQPISVGDRLSMLAELNEQYSKIDGVWGIRKISTARFSARIYVRGKAAPLGEYRNRELASGRQRVAIKTLLEALYAADTGGAPKIDGVRLRYKKTDCSFWVAVSRDSDHKSHALPKFFYGDPLDALLFIEWLCTKEANSGIPYLLERHITASGRLKTRRSRAILRNRS